MGVCPWAHLIVFMFGAGTCILGVSLVGTVAYNGKFGDDNKFRQYGYGLDWRLSQLTVATVSFSIFTLVFMAVAMGLAILHCPSPSSGVMWIITCISFLGVVLCQIFILQHSQYGDYMIPSKYSHYDEDEEYRNYVDRFFPDLINGDNDSYGVIEFPELAPITDQNGTTRYYPVPRNLDMTQFYSTFYYNGYIFHVPSCVINFSASSLVGIDPCNYALVSLGCIGEWDAEKFKNYWCYQYRQNMSIYQDLEKFDNDNERENYLAERHRDTIAVDSYYMFFEANCLFLGLNILGFLVTMITNIFAMYINPFDKQKNGFKEIDASGSGMFKSDDSSNNKRAKAVKSSSGGGSQSGSGSGSSAPKGLVAKTIEESDDSSIPDLE